MAVQGTIGMRCLVGTLLLAIGSWLPFASAAAQEAAQSRAPVVPEGQSLLEWMGLEAGDTMAFVDEADRRFCVRVGEPRWLEGRAWAPLQGLPWPGLATDSQILVPLDGSLGLGIIRTPGPRPQVDALLEAISSNVRFLPDLTPANTLGTPVADGWYAFGESATKPAALLYVWCGRCMDAGTTVWLERGRGIVQVESITIAGSERLARVAEPCETPGVRFQLYVAPPPPRDP